MARKGVRLGHAATLLLTLFITLLKIANIFGALASTILELTRRVAIQLDEAKVCDLMIPSMSNECDTIYNLDIFLNGYLQEIARDVNVPLSKFIALAEAFPGHARVNHDDLYQGLETGRYAVSTDVGYGVLGISWSTDAPYLLDGYDVLGKSSSIFIVDQSIIYGVSLMWTRRILQSQAMVF
ncbi:BTB/POZ domain-containing protein-like protein [Tanacetum coccineum]